MNDLLNSFLETMRAENSASDNTILAYNRDLLDYFQQCENPFSATHNDIEKYLGQMTDQGFAESTRARRLSSIKQFYRFLYEEGLRTDDPTHRLKGPKQKKSLPKTLTEEEVDRLLEAACKTGSNDIDRRRNTVLMQLLYATGMRVSELVSLPIASVRGDPEMILIKGKGGKERLVPLSTPAKMAIASYVSLLDDLQKKQMKTGESSSPFLFPSRGKLGHLTRIRFYTLIKEIAVTAGVSPEKVTPHILRHAFATHLLAGGADLRVIQMLLGHADIATTEIYTHVLDEKMKELVFKHHPLA